MSWFWLDPNQQYAFSPRGVPINCTNYLAFSEKQDVLTNMRTLMKQHRIGIYLVLEPDEHQSEYVSDHDRRIRFVSGFTGSSAVISIGQDFAELATDSRYYLIAEKQLGPEWTVRKLGLPGVENWETAIVKKAAELKVDIGVDPRLIGADLADRLQASLIQHGQTLRAVTTNLCDACWHNQPNLPSVPVTEHPIEFTGEHAVSKLARLRSAISEAGVKSIVLYSLEEIAWLLNLRGGDIPYVPVFKAFMVVSLQSALLYTNKEVPPAVRDLVVVKSYDDFFTSKAESPVWVPNGGTWAIDRQYKGTLNAISPCNLMRAVKNKTEIDGIWSAQLKCSLSIVKYLAWMEQHVHEGISEYEGGEKLLEIRSKLPDFKGNSFETISATGPNASAPHYSPTRDECSIISPSEVYLLDSGSQFLQGSTDITRTVHFGQPTPEEVKAYTLVLQGQLAVMTACFPPGTSGYKLDILARQFLWKEGMNYGHGTGHGIGSYLNIHELPLGIGMSSGPESILVPGHFVSDEPGFYKDNHFGVRLESDILVVEKSADYLGFEVPTVVPYEPKLIDVNRLSPQEITFINSYHRRCAEVLKPHLSGHELKWLERCTKELQ